MPTSTGRSIYWRPYIYLSMILRASAPVMTCLWPLWWILWFPWALRTHIRLSSIFRIQRIFILFGSYHPTMPMRIHAVISSTPVIITLREANAYSSHPWGESLFITFPGNSYFHTSRGECLLAKPQADAYFIWFVRGMLAPYAPRSGPLFLLRSGYIFIMTHDVDAYFLRPQTGFLLITPHEENVCYIRNKDPSSTWGGCLFLTTAKWTLTFYHSAYLWCSVKWIPIPHTLKADTCLLCSARPMLTPYPL